MLVIFLYGSFLVVKLVLLKHVQAHNNIELSRVETARVTALNKLLCFVCSRSIVQQCGTCSN